MNKKESALHLVVWIFFCIFVLLSRQRAEKSGEYTPSYPIFFYTTKKKGLLLTVLLNFTILNL